MPQKIFVFDLDQTLICSEGALKWLNSVNKEKLDVRDAPYFDRCYILHKDRMAAIMQAIINNGDRIACITSGEASKFWFVKFFKKQYNIILTDRLLDPDYQGENGLKKKLSATLHWISEHPTYYGDPRKLPNFEHYYSLHDTLPTLNQRPLIDTKELPKFEYYNKLNDKLPALKRISRNASSYGNVIFIDNSYEHLTPAKNAGFTTIYAYNNVDDTTHGEIYIKQLEMLVAERTREVQGEPRLMVNG
ncbi:hypothetical protein [Piscirickettsia salmonis]|uniref:hypothetical protein n=1 Tax=Piscirickettsia salmonis TaxID=1238 RepID=UPI0007C989A0|nr:hypothetical protein A0O36_01827 [Piscirickettsiaceae bacterium NZ-RLO1]